LRKLSAVVIAALTVLAACGTSTKHPNQASGTSSTAPGSATGAATNASSVACTPDKVGGALTYGEFIQPPSLDPANPVGATGVIGGAEMLAIYSALMRYNPTTGKYEPWIAQSLTSNADATQWTLKLRDGVVFGDGDPLDAAAVKASIERHSDPTLHSSLQPFMANIASIATPDPKTVVFTLNGPWGSLPWFLAGTGGMIVDTKVATAAGSSFSTIPKGAGVGPYEPVKYATNEEIDLQAKTNWWGGPLCIQQLRFVRLNGAPTTYAALKAGQLDVAFIREAPTIGQAKDDKYAVYTNHNNAGGMVFINNRPTAPGGDLRIRQAIAYSINPQEINQRAYDDKATATSALIGPQSKWYQGLAGPPFDPTKAEQILQGVLAEHKYDGNLQLLCPSDPTSQQVALTVQAQLQATGFKVNLQLMPTITQAMNQANYQLACNGAAISDAAPYVQLQQQFTSAGPRIAFKNPQFEAAVNQLKAATTDDAVKADLKTIQDLWNQLIPSIVTNVIDEAIVSAPKVKGLQFTQDTTTIFDEAYIQK
jgi:peptide/nickel transport system substrate-binding protein